MFWKRRRICYFSFAGIFKDSSSFCCLSFQMAICCSRAANAACSSFVLCCCELEVLSARSWNRTYFFARSRSWRVGWMRVGKRFWEKRLWKEIHVKGRGKGCLCTTWSAVAVFEDENKTRELIWPLKFLMENVIYNTLVLDQNA